MVKDWAALVEEFNRANGYEPPDVPTALIPPEVKLLRLRLMMEELGELTCAMHENNLVEIADGIADLIYVVVGTAVDYGFGPALDAIFREVQRSNMSKDFITGADGRKGGIKGASFTPPDIAEILDAFIDAKRQIHQVWDGKMAGGGTFERGE